jgi:hypothetical protein
VKNPKEALPKVSRTSAGLRDALFDELDRLRNGETNATNANAVARLADQVINTVSMELEVAKHMQKVGDKAPSAALPPPIALGAAAIPA